MQCPPKAEFYVSNVMFFSEKFCSFQRMIQTPKISSEFEGKSAPREFQRVQQESEEVPKIDQNHLQTTFIDASAGQGECEHTDELGTPHLS